MVNIIIPIMISILESIQISLRFKKCFSYQRIVHFFYIFQSLASVSDLMSRLKRTSVSGLMTSQVVDTRRRKSMSSAIKEKNVIVILAIIAIVFAACNIPMAVARIMIGPSHAKNVAFQVWTFSDFDAISFGRFLFDFVTFSLVFLFRRF